MSNIIPQQPDDAALKHAKAFVKILTSSDANECHFRTFADKGSTPALTKKFHGKVKTLAAELANLNKQGAGVFMVINEGGQTKDEITRVRAVFADTDGAEIEPLLCLNPHMVVQSSPGNWHVYWLVDADFPLGMFRPIQLAIAAKYGTDPAVNDLSRVMRVPGFNHNKAEPFPVHITQFAKGLPPYSLEEIVTGLGLTLDDKQPLTAAFSNSSTSQIPETDENISRVREMLDAIPAAKQDGCDRELYRQVVWSVAATGWNCAKEIATEWCLRSPEDFDAGHFEREWNSFDPEHPTGTKFGTLVYLARQYGYQGMTPSSINAAAPVAIDTPDAQKIIDHEPGDILAGQQYARGMQGKLVWVSPIGKWLEWDGARWVWCECGEEMKAAKRIAGKILEYAAKQFASDPNKHGQLLKFAKNLQNLKRLEAMIALAKSEDGMTVGSMSELDGNPWLLGVRNGVVNLKDGGLLAADPAMLITRQVAAEYHRGAECPKWLEFLNQIFEGDHETIGFVQRALGYTLTGTVTEEALFICLGHGANGKSVFSNVIGTIMADYSRAAPASLLTVRRADDAGPRNDLAMLCGARLVSINETQSGDRLDEQIVKTLAGREMVSARFLHKEYFDFWPTAKPWLRTNHKPIITGEDDGIWRRLNLIPFRRKFAEHERDPWLESKLLDERDGILAWMIEGCLEWQRVGLKPSATVRRESATYRKESDLLGEFLEEVTVVDPNARIEQSRLFMTYTRWHEANGTRAGSKNTLTRKMAERGFNAMRSNGQRFYAGLSLMSPTLV